MNEIHKVTVNGYGVRVDAAPTQDSSNAVSSGGVFDTIFTDNNTVGGTWKFGRLSVAVAPHLNTTPESGEIGYWTDTYYGSALIVSGKRASLCAGGDRFETKRTFSITPNASYIGVHNQVGMLEEVKVDGGTSFNQMNVGRPTQKLLVRGLTLKMQAGEKELLLDEAKLQKLDDLLNQ